MLLAAAAATAARVALVAAKMPPLRLYSLYLYILFSCIILQSMDVHEVVAQHVLVGDRYIYTGKYKFLFAIQYTSSYDQQDEI